MELHCLWFLLKTLKKWSGILILILLCDQTVANTVVSTTSGLLHGVTVTRNRLRIEAFLGVPYAEPPINHLRFKKPVPKTPWTEVFHATRIPPPCIQNVTFQHYWEPDVRNMTEDCLYLNIWVPYTKENTKFKTVIVFIHGGAFSHGSCSMPVYDGTNLAEFGDVIVANMNYRVGVMGFFSAFIEEADGNMGIFDQILATRWIKDNALSFGGDPDNIVLMGESAGAVILSGHLTSPLTRNLFNRVIMQSGAATLPLISEDNARLYNLSQHVASMVGCSDGPSTLKDNPKRVVECLRRIPPNVIAAAEGVKIGNSKITFLPRVGDSYLPTTVIKALQNGTFSDVNMLIGFNGEEGTLFLSAASPELFGHNRVTPVSKTFAYHLIRNIFTFTDQRNEKEIAEQYTNSIGDNDTTKAIAMSLGDYLINCNSVFHAEFHSVRNPVFFYVFGRRGSSTPLAEWMGTTHFDEIQYVFGNPLFGNFTEEEVEFSHRMMARWIAFAKTGNPNVPGSVQWPLFRYQEPDYLHLDDKDSVRSRPDNYRCEFWRDRYRARTTDEILRRIQGTVRSGSSSLHSNLLANSVVDILVSASMTFMYLRHLSSLHL